MCHEVVVGSVQQFQGSTGTNNFVDWSILPDAKERRETKLKFFPPECTKETL